MTEEHNAKITSSLLLNPPNKGKRFSEEYREKLSLARKKYYAKKRQEMAMAIT